MLYNPINKKLISKAILVAAKGIPNAFTNSVVGCLIYYDNEILSTGSHKEFGSSHVELFSEEKRND